jgi:HTH domain
MADAGSRRPRGGASTPSRIPCPFAAVPIDIIFNASVSDGALRAFTVMAAVRDGDRCSISEKRLAERLRRSRRTAHAHIHELIRAGAIEPLNANTKRCGIYRIVALTCEARFSSSRTLEGESVKKFTETCAIPFSTTAANGFTHPRYTDIPLESGRSQRDKSEGSLRDSFLSELRRCDLNGSTPEEEADRLVRRFPGLLFSLFCHLRYALETKIEKPIEYAERKTARGTPPKLA